MMDIGALVSRIDLQREHQVRAVRAALEAFLLRGQRGLVLADEVGCGKTYEALATAALLWRHHLDTERPVRRILILAKPALMQKWLDEVEAHPGAGRGFPQYIAGNGWEGFRRMLDDVVVVDRLDAHAEGGTRDRGKLQAPPDRLYIVKDTLSIKDMSGATGFIRWLGRTDWDVIIADEAHHYAGLHRKKSQVFFPDQTIESRGRGLSGRFLLALTATPFQLATREIPNLLRIINAPEEDIEAVADGVERYERALDAFYARRHTPSDEPARQRCVERLEALRMSDASAGTRPGTPGLEALLRRYILRNVKETGMRRYSLTEQTSSGYDLSSFDKLDDLRSKVAQSSLIPFENIDAWVYLNLRDLVSDAQAKQDRSEDARPTFVAGDLRQALSSYEQLAASALAQRRDLPRAAELKGRLSLLAERGHRHPKVRALVASVETLIDAEIEKQRQRPAAGFSKILVFNKLMKTAGALKAALEDAVRRRIEPFIEEEARAAGFSSVTAAGAMVRESLASERQIVREDLDRRFEQRFLLVDQELLRGTSIDVKSEERHLVDLMFDRLERHCTQPLFLLRLARWLRATGHDAGIEEVQLFLAQRVGERLRKSLDRIVDHYLDDDPLKGEAFSDENRAKASREIGRLARILGSPEYVGRFDGEQNTEERELRRENFNRPYAPLILLVSAVGEEGIDLQQHTRYLLHYDLEWNPAKMEQREGRVDREGRRTRGEGAVDVRFFLLKDTYEERIFHTVMQRDAWFQVLIGSKRQELGKLSDGDEEDTGEDMDLGGDERGRLTPDERRRVMLDLRP